MLFSGCKKNIEETNQNTLCDGNGSDTYIPLEINNKWIYNSNGMGGNEGMYTLEIVGHEICLGQEFYKLTVNNGANFYKELFYRIDEIGNIWEYLPESIWHQEEEYILIPSNPVEGQILQNIREQSQGIQRKVITVTGTIEVRNECNFYDELLIIDRYYTDPSITIGRRWSCYKKGLGMVFQDYGHDEIKEVVIK